MAQSFHREDLGAVPVIDAHTHYVRDLPADLPLATVEKELEVRLRVMDALNIRKAVVLCSGWGKEQPNVEHASSEKAAFHLLRKAPGRFVVFTTVDFSRMDRPDFSAGAARHLEETCVRAPGA